MSDLLKVTDSAYMPLRDVVFNSLRQAIIKGELSPGQRLLEIQLAEKLGVSRTPVREAIRKLELEGLVVMNPRRGAIVSGITQKNLQNVLEIRRALEELAVELACQRITPEQLKEMKQINKEFAEISNSEDAIMVASIDEKFHQKIYEATDNQRLMSLLGNLREQVYRYRLEHIRELGKRDSLVKEHEDMIKAIESGNSAAGKKAVRNHINKQEIIVGGKNV